MDTKCEQPPDDDDDVLYDAELGCYHDLSNIDRSYGDDLERQSKEYVDEQDIKPCSVCYPTSSQSHFIDQQQEIMTIGFEIPKYTPPTAQTRGGDPNDAVPSMNSIMGSWGQVSTDEY